MHENKIFSFTSNDIKNLDWIVTSLKHYYIEVQTEQYRCTAGHRCQEAPNNFAYLILTLTWNKACKGGKSETLREDQGWR